MKKLIAIILLICCSSVLGQQISPTPEQLAAWENFKAAFGHSWQIQWDKTGTPKKIHGGTTSPQIADPQTIATVFLNLLKDIFGFSSVQQNLLYSGTSPTTIDTFIVHHVRFQPHLNGIPILDSRISVHINKKGEIFLVNAMVYRFSAPFDRAAPLLVSEAAKAIAMLNIEQSVILTGEITTKLGYVYKNDSYILVWRVTIPTREPIHDWVIDVSQDGIIINKWDLTCYATGTARVYLHNPLVSDTVRRPLYNLDSSCYVKGTYADVKNYDTTARAYACNLQFIYDTSDVRFDEGNVYYHIQSLAQRFAALGLPIQRQFEAFVRATGNFLCNAAYLPGSKKIYFGKGGDSCLFATIRNTAFEESVIYHELGHYIHDTLLGWDITWFISTGEGRILAEGLSDYFAASISGDPLLHEWTLPQTYRTADNNMIYPDSMGGCTPPYVWPYCQSQFVSGTCWDIKNLMNEQLHPDKLVWVAINLSEGNDTIADFWNNLVIADRQIGDSDDLRAIHFGWIPRWNTTRPVNTNPDVFTPYFSPDPPGTVYEGNCYLLCTRATQTIDSFGYKLDYYWKSKYVTFPMNYPIDVCVTYCPPVVNQIRTDSIWVWVYDGLGGVDSAVKIVTIHPQPGGGCPYLYTWDGKQFVQDNTLLTQSEFNPTATSVADLYQLTQPLVEKEGEYLLQIREFEKEETELDEVDLIAVDHPPAVRVGVTPEGKILAYDKFLLPVSCTDNEGNDQLELITNKDAKLFQSKGAGYLLLTFNNPKSKEFSNYLRPIIAEDPDAIDPCGSPCYKRIGVNNRVLVELEDSEGHWHTLGTVAPRANADKTFWVLGSSDVQLGEQFRVKLSWSIDYEADWLGFFLPTEQTWYQESIGLKRAIHSKKGNVAQSLSVADGNLTKLVPGERIDLKFPVSSSKPEGMVRDFFFKAVGYYKKYDNTSNAGALSYQLHNNYPNPFNAVTEIQYSLPEPSEVNLSVFNIMGQKVRTLVEGRQSAGVHKVIWDGKNENGEAVASGVYFYTLRTGSYIETKKMTLLK